MTKITVDASSVDEAVIIMTRMFDAPREKVWECFTKPEHVKRWFGGAGYSNPVCEMDVRPGGLWKHVMRTPDGQDYNLDFVYIELKKPERLVWESVGHSEKRAGGPPTCRQTITLEDHGGQTKWTLVATFHSLADRDMAKSYGFADMISEGCERLNAVAKELANG
jgi:uncharacterized protein YndB with AHSA1/START domain